MTGLNYLYLAFFTWFVTSANAVQLSDYVNFVPKEIPRLVISSYPNSTQFAYQQWLRESEGLFETYFSMRMKFKESSSCQSLLEANQLYPLNWMLTTGYLSREHAEILIKLGDRLNSAQFRVFELIRQEEAKNLAGKTIDAEKGDIPYSILPIIGDNLGLTQATIWVVAAQTTSSHVRFLETKMPWQLDDGYKELPLHRSENTLFWEIGRGAQRTAGSMETLLRAAALSMLNETLARGLRPENGYVFMHAMGVSQARLFKMRRSLKTDKPVFSTFARASETDEVVMARLSDFLDTFPPHLFSKKLRGIIDLTGGRLSWFGAAEHLYAVRDHLHQHLELVSPHVPDRTHPIVLRNTTPTPGWFMAKVSERYGVYDVGPKISSYLSSKGWQESTLPLDRNVDLRVPQTKDLEKHKLIGLSNLSDSSAKAYSKYVKLVLLASYFYWERTLRAEYPQETDQLLEMTRFAINSSYESIIEQGKAIPGAEALSFESVDYTVDMEVKDGNIKLQPKVDVYGGPGFVFNRRAILALIQTDAALAKEARNALRKGNWQIQNMTFELGVQ